MLPFRERLTREQRLTESRRLLSVQPAYVPVIVERGDRRAPLIDREKYLVPRDLSMAHFQCVVRRRLRLERDESFFLLCGGTLLHGSASLQEVFDAHHDRADGFLYMQYTLENTFG